VQEEPGARVWDALLQRAAANSQRTKYQAMLAETRTLLRAFYAPFNRRLAQALGDERWLWGDG
jgi:hypothetical protein